MTIQNGKKERVISGSGFLNMTVDEALSTHGIASYEWSVPPASV